ncbi:MAG: NlpC/P60 family protein [Thermodesulfovibrionales bacterium]|jgi:cell wall-associated NlpC family hydrolase|nr:NlpC/P60 family protein [Thermodesulfovibrionales bacterium]
MTEKLRVKSQELRSVYWLLATLLVIGCWLMATSAYAETYTVKNGDSLHKIAKKFNVSESGIKKANNLKSGKLKAGTKLSIPSNKIYHTVKKGDTPKKITNKTNKLKAGQQILAKKKSRDIEESRKAFYKEKSTRDAEDELKEPEDIKSIKANYDRKATPVITSARLEEVKELSNSKDLSKMSIKERLILFAKKMLHLPYQFGGNGSFGLDCSAYVQKVYSITGIELPRSAREQFKIGEAIDKEELAIGDLVFFRTYASFPSHVGIYLGNNLFIHASTRSRRVTIDSLEEPYYVKRFIGAKRLIPEDEVKIAETPTKEK